MMLIYSLQSFTNEKLKLSFINYKNSKHFESRLLAFRHCRLYYTKSDDKIRELLQINDLDKDFFVY